MAKPNYKKPTGPARKTAQRLLVAGRVLEIYAKGGNYAEVVQEFGAPKCPFSGRKLNAENVLAWATGCYLNDEVKAAGAARVIAELEKIAFANMRDYITTTPSGDCYVDLSALSRDQAAAIQEVTVSEYTEGRGENARDIKATKFKLSDKRAALVELGKHYGVGQGKTEATITHLVKQSPVDLSDLSDAELQALVEMAAKVESGIPEGSSVH